MIIDVVPTQKLFFNKFTYCIKIQAIQDRSFFSQGNTLIAEVKNWLADNDIPHRSRIDWHQNKKNINITLGIYLSDSAAYQYLFNNYSAHINWISKPINDTHNNLLLNKTELEFKEKLYYKNFRYKIIFKPQYINSGVNLRSQILELMVDKRQGRTYDYVFINNWSPILYIKNDDDLVLFKLSLSEHIRKIIRVELFKEHNVDATAIKP